MINLEQLKNYIIVPTLKQIDCYSVDAVNLLLGTALQESRGGMFLRQLNGPACGIYQMEPATAQDIIDNYLKYKNPLLEKVFSFYNYHDSLEDNLTGNLFFATAMCRVHYLRVKESLPKTPLGYATYWKKYYNTSKGKGNVEEFLDKYNKYLVR